MEIDAVTFFFFPGGHIVADGYTTVRAIFDDIGNGLDGNGEAGVLVQITHLTASIPGKQSNIVDASGRFRGLVGTGHVRLSGAVNTDDFFIDNNDIDPNTNNPMAFSCYFAFSNGGRGRSGNAW